MTQPQNEIGSKEEEHATAGEKHQTEHESSETKRTKTEKQPTLEESFNKNGSSDTSGQSSAKDTKEEDDESAVKPGEEPEVPSNILEKGIIYFFIRGRVGIDNPGGVDDIARSYIILRPIEKDAKLGEGPISDAGNSRLLALPKKVLPLSGKDRFMIFVEKGAASFKSIRETFLSGSDYTTKTTGTRHTPPATPAGEGVYAITTTGRESHLAYMLTLPEKLEEVQKELGLREKGSFIMSTKNPTQKGPAFAQLDEKPEFSKEIMDEFRSLRWLPSRPSHLNYANAQVLLVGESTGIKKATEKQEEDEEEGNEDPEEALENLEDEDLKRMRHLPGGQSASIYSDLEVQAKDYPKLQTTFE